MKAKTDFYVVVDQENNIWERAFDFSDSKDYFDRELSAITKANLLTLKNANKLKKELDDEIASCNDIMFQIKNVSIII